MKAYILNLEDWLRIATEKLWFPAKERIKQEVESHFEEAVETYRIEGLTEVQALARALADLGAPEIAAKRFNKSHLTEEEALRLETHWKFFQGTWRSFSPRNFFCGLFLSIFVFIFWIFKKQHIPFLIPGIVGIIFLTTTTISFLVTRRGRSQSTFRLLYTLDLAGSISYLMLAGFVFCAASLNWDILLFVTAGFLIEIPKLRLLLKLQKIDEKWQEMPSSDVTAS